MLCYNANKQTSHNLMINVHSIVVYCEMQLQLVWYVHRCPKELTGQSCCLTLSCVFTGAPRSSQDRAVVSPCLVCSQVPQGAHRTELLSHLVLCVHRCPKELTGQSCCLTLSCVFTGAPRSSQDRAVVSPCLVCSQVPQGAHRTELLSHLDRLPTSCQQLMFTIKSPTVGKAATFNKVMQSNNCFNQVWWS